MSLDAAALELARALGWMGGALYLVDLVGGRLHRWREQHQLDRQMRELGPLPPPPPFPAGPRPPRPVD